MLIDLYFLSYIMFNYVAINVYSPENAFVILTKIMFSPSQYIYSQNDILE